MRYAEFKTLVSNDYLLNVNFIESSCGPMVIEVEYEIDNEHGKQLLKNDKGEVMSVNCITKAYDLCTNVGVHSANLVQTIPHDEACMGKYADYHSESMPLKF